MSGEETQFRDAYHRQLQQRSIPHIFFTLSSLLIVNESARVLFRKLFGFIDRLRVATLECT